MSTNRDEQRQKPDQLRDHDYDGIQEYDNSLPRWWVWLFVLCIIFAIFYLGYYHFGSGVSLQSALADDLRISAAKQAASTGSSMDKVNWQDEKLIAQGQADYMVTCLPCHGDKGQGNIGPNLTDKFWLHGSTPEKIFATVANGVVEKGMPAWKPVLGEEKIKGLTAFLLTLKNTNASGGKEPQGAEEP